MLWMFYQGCNDQGSSWGNSIPFSSSSVKARSVRSNLCKFAGLKWKMFISELLVWNLRAWPFLNLLLWPEMVYHPFIMRISSIFLFPLSLGGALTFLFTYWLSCPIWMNFPTSSLSLQQSFVSCSWSLWYQHYLDMSFFFRGLHLNWFRQLT